MRSRQVLNDKLQTRKPDSSGLGSCLSSSSLVVFFIRIRQRQKPCPVSRKPPLPAYLLSLVLDLGAVSIPRNSIGPAGYRINRDYARRGWATGQS